jgi:pimeloyl-ACP methyl ester carboxylesterase
MPWRACCAQRHLPFLGGDLYQGSGPMLEVIDKGSVTDSHPTPLLFVHGASIAAWCWDEHFLDFFASRGYRAAALSLRGHGASTLSKPLNSCSLADYVDDVTAVVGKLGFPQCSSVTP